MHNLKEVLADHKLTEEDYENILKILDGREPTFVEIGIFSAMWSEHCSYKSSKKYLNGFPTKAPWVIQGPGENAGVIDIGDGIAAVFKMESHNHPSFIEPYQGAATGVGGILRDVFTMGARPVANLNAIRFGDISKENENGKLHRHLLRGVVAGIGDYGNCMGVPTIGGETTFEDCYDGNILVNAFTLGIAKSDEIFYGKAEGFGNPIIYVGSKTGRDGLGGAVMSSDSFTEESKKLRPTVQVGDPFAEKLLLEACLELFKEDLIVGIQDMGAAGLTSSSFEMAGRSGSGLIMHLDKVPMREDKMTPYELMLSESQERMLICAQAGKEEEVLKIFRKWELDAEVIGEVTDSGNMELFWHGDRVCNMPVLPVSENAPVLDRPTSEPKYLSEVKELDLDIFTPISNQNAFDELSSHIEVIDKAWIYEQYDSMVQTNTNQGGGALDGSVIRVKENGKALAMSSDCNTRFCYVNPKRGASSAVIESGRNVAIKGGKPLAITDCLNFGNPENPEVMWQFANACEGIKEACATMQTPVVSGNVSLYNETNGVSIYPTPTIAMVGVIPSEEKIVNSKLKKAGNSLYLIGETKSEFGASLYLKALYNQVKGEMPELDFAKEQKLWNLLLEANEQDLIKSAKDLNVGGLAIALAKMSAVSGLGVKVKTDLGRDIFSESLSRAVVEIENDSSFVALAEKIGLKVTKIGEVTESNLEVDDIKVSQSELKSRYFETFTKIIERDL